jgi:hypothetical protein
MVDSGQLVLKAMCPNSWAIFVRKNLRPTPKSIAQEGEISPNPVTLFYHRPEKRSSRGGIFLKLFIHKFSKSFPTKEMEY